MTQAEASTKSGRKSISKRLRFEILRRDGYRCRYCGRGADDGIKLTVDHVIPDTLGGQSVPENLVACCQDCNQGKSSIAPDSVIVEDVAADALRWGRAIQYASTELHSERHQHDGEVEHAEKSWCDWQVRGKVVPRPLDWETNLRRWLSGGLDVHDFEDAVNIAMANSSVRPRNTWAYVCGIMWRRLDELQDRARLLIDSGMV